MFARVLVLLALTLTVAAGVVYLVGARLPVSHVAARSAVVSAAPDSVFRLLADFSHHPAWRRTVSSVELLEPVNGRTRFVEHSGSDALTFEVVESDPPRRLATRIVDEGLPFGGTWVIEVAPAEAGSRVTITEHGQVYSPVFRFVSRYVMGHTRTIDAYLASLVERLGGDSIIGPGTPGAAPAG